MGQKREHLRWLLWSALSAAGCAHKPRPSAHLFPEPVTITGHRGAASLAPENTMAGFQVAADLGVSFELDTTPCGSGELVVIHDDTLSPTMASISIACWISSASKHSTTVMPGISFRSRSRMRCSLVRGTQRPHSFGSNSARNMPRSPPKSSSKSTGVWFSITACGCQRSLIT